jgi:DNA-binding SARP family transcriptional activator/TolB-like protein
MESPRPPIQEQSAGLTVQMLGRLALFRGDLPVELPTSRKVRALLAYLALATHPIGRSRLCDLLGDVPNDPRGELRWCLSKLRTVLDEPGRHRVVAAAGDMISLDLDDCLVDAIEVDAATRSGLETLSVERLRALCDLFVGDFLEGLDLNRSPQLDHWLAAQRRRYRTCHVAMIEQLIKMLPDDHQEMRSYAEKWVELSPFDTRAQILLLTVLMASGQPSEAERHLAAAARLFETEELDFAPIRMAWRQIRDRQTKAHNRTTVEPLVIGTTALAEVADIAEAAGPRRGSLAVMPFVERDAGNGLRLAAGLTHDIITRLAKLRNLFVIARGSVFALAERGIGPEDAARRLNVDYVASGLVQHHPGNIVVTVELVEARTARIVWSEEFDLKPDDAFLILDRIGDMIVSSIAAEIETAEKNRAILKPPNSLNAWEAYHRGLWHMYRFTKEDNAQAQHFFLQSSAEDPTFARAYAGLSFTHWQNAFQRWADRERETDLAFETAGRSLMADDHDPAAHWAMGRALWLRRKQDEAISELERAVDLSPNFALGHYSLSFVHSQSGDPAAAISSSDHSRSLSPFDPLLFAMFGARAMAHVRLGQFEDAAEWAIRAAARPNAHNIILAIAAHCLALAGRLEEARTFAGVLRQALPNYRVDDFLTTFKFSPDAEALFRQAARQLGLD